MGGMEIGQPLSTVLDVTDELHFSGQANAGGLVRPGAHLDLHGQMNGTLIIEEGGSAGLHGQLNGRAVVAGLLDVTGQLIGSIRVSGSGRVTFATGSSLVRHGRTLVVSDVGKFEPLPSTGFSYVITKHTDRWLYQSDGSLIPANPW